MNPLRATTTQTEDERRAMYADDLAYHLAARGLTPNAMARAVLIGITGAAGVYTFLLLMKALPLVCGG